jgi:hypothetical protein
MNENTILDETHRGRADHARACRYDVDVIFAAMHEDLERLRSEGWQIVSLAPKRIEEPTAMVRKEPPKP